MRKILITGAYGYLGAQDFVIILQNKIIRLLLLEGRSHHLVPIGYH